MSARRTVAAPDTGTGTLDRIESFFFAPATEWPMAVLRTGLAAVLLLQAWWLSPDLLDLFGRSGLVQGALADHIAGPDLLEDSGFRPLMRWAGVPEPMWLRGLFVMYVGALAAALSGWFSGAACLAACVLHAVLIGSGPTASYGVDLFAQVGLFYLALAPAPWTTLTAVFRSRTCGQPGSWNRFVLRALQLHLCAAYLATGLDKAQGAGWWMGEAVWRALMMPEYATLPADWLAGVPVVARVLGWMTLVLEIGYPIFVWPRRTRRVWVLAVCGLHLGILVSLSLVTFSLAMCVLTLAAFGSDPEPDVSGV